MEQIIKQYKRQNRSVPQNVRDKISASLKGKKKSAEHCEHISQSLRADTGGYWSHIKKATPDPDKATINDIMM